MIPAKVMRLKMNDFQVSESLINKQLPHNENFIQPLTCEEAIVLFLMSTSVRFELKQIREVNTDQVASPGLRCSSVTFQSWQLPFVNRLLFVSYLEFTDISRVSRKYSAQFTLNLLIFVCYSSTIIITLNNFLIIIF